MKKLLTIVLTLMLTTTFAQTIEDVRAEKSGNKINIYYDISGANSNQNFEVRLYCSTDGGASFGSKLQEVSGDVGKYIKGGYDKKITWDNIEERVKSESKIVFFRIKAIVTEYEEKDCHYCDNGYIYEKKDCDYCTNGRITLKIENNLVIYCNGYYYQYLTNSSSCFIIMSSDYLNHYRDRYKIKTYDENEINITISEECKKNQIESSRYYRYKNTTHYKITKICTHCKGTGKIKEKIDCPYCENGWIKTKTTKSITGKIIKYDFGIKIGQPVVPKKNIETDL